MPTPPSNSKSASPAPKPSSAPQGASAAKAPPAGKAPGGAVAPLPPPVDFARSPRWEIPAAAVLAIGLIVCCWFVPRPTGDLYVAFAGARDVMDGKLGKPNGLAGPGTRVPANTPGAPLVRVLAWFGVQTGAADDWSFDEPRPVWMNQNWGTHLLFYAAWKTFGPNGVPGLKAVLMLTLAACVALACRQHKVRWSVCLLMGGCAVVGGHAYIDLRPNLILLTLAPMMYWLLVRSRHDPRRIWWAVALLAVWGNMHGSFIFGLGMVVLWAICDGLPAAVRDEADLRKRLAWFCLLGLITQLPLAALMLFIVRGASLFGWLGGEPGYWLPFLVPLAGLYALRRAPAAVREGFRRRWPVTMAPLIGAVLVTVVTPFGLENLTHPLIMGRSEEWRKVAEWTPVLCLEKQEYGSIMEFFIAMGLMAFLASLRPLGGVLLDKRRAVLSDGVLVAFSFVVSLVVTVSAWGVYSILDRRLAPLESAMARGFVASQDVGAVQGAIDTYATLRFNAFLPLCVFAGIALLAVYAAYRLAASLPRDAKRARPAPAETGETSLLVFAIVIVGIVLQMAFTSRRFVTLSLGLVAPLIAMQLEWVFGQARRVTVFRYAPPAVLAGVLALIPAHRLIVRSLPTYLAANPSFPPELDTVFDRMTANNAYSHGGADFLNGNGVVGNIIESWRWEGFLHWKSPQMKLWVGGRAQQAYDEPAYRHRSLVLGLYGMPTRTEDELRAAYAKVQEDFDSPRMKVRFVIGQIGEDTSLLFSALLHPRGGGARWGIVYDDRETRIVADSADPAVQALMNRIVSGEAHFPAWIPGVGAYSRAMLMSGFPGRYSAEERRRALEEGFRQMPWPELVERLYQMYANRELSADQIASFLSEQFRSLAESRKNPYADLKALIARGAAANAMASVLASEAGWPGPSAVRLDAWLQEQRANPKAQGAVAWFLEYLKAQDDIRAAATRWRE